MNETIQKAKSYWSRPEGKTGMALLAAAGGGLIYGWGKIVPFLVDMVADTLKLGMLSVGLIVFLLVVFSPKTHMMFRLLTRWITGLVVELDPIGILKDRALQLAKRKENFDEKKVELNGARQTLEQSIERNVEERAKQQKIALNAKDRMGKTTAATERLRMQTELQVAMNEIQRLENGTAKFEKLKKLLDRIYDVLDRSSVYLDGLVRDAQNEARQWDIQRKTSRVASGAIGSALKIIKGKASENDIYNLTLEKLADEYSERIGAVDSGMKDIESFMAKVDLETGFVPDEAFSLAEEFEKKLALPARAALIEIPSGQTVQPHANEYSRILGGGKKE